MSDRYCKIFFEGNKSDIENLKKEKDWKFELQEIDNKTLLCKIGDEFYDELEFFKGLTVDELERTKILDIQEIDELDYNKEVNAIKEKEERDKNQEIDERNADNVEDNKEQVENESEKVKNEIHNEKEKKEEEGESKRNEDNFEINENKNLEETPKEKEINNEIKNNFISEPEKHSSPKKQNNLEEKKEKSNKKEISNKEIEPEEEKYEKINLKDALLPSKNKLDENDIMKTLISKDYLIKFFVIASGVITFLCFFEK